MKTEHYTKFFYGTDCPLPNGWVLYSVTEDWRQEYSCAVRKDGKRGFRLQVIITRGEISFRTLYRENFKKEHVEDALVRFVEFYNAYLKMEEEYFSNDKKSATNCIKLES